MNEKIKLIRKQAVDWVQHDLETVERDHAVMEQEQLEMVNAKFAELIVKECVSVAHQHNNSGEGAVIAQTIEQHFGVEE